MADYLYWKPSYDEGRSKYDDEITKSVRTVVRNLMMCPEFSEYEGEDMHSHSRGETSFSWLYKATRNDTVLVA